MPLNKCEICAKSFYAKPSHIKIGWGRFCSSKCQYRSYKTGKYVVCHTCGVEVYKRLTSLAHSKSKKYFCSKSCQTKWRNRQYMGDKHLQWKEGKSVYRNILVRNGLKPRCLLCKLKDKRILAVHQIDHDRSNNKIENLSWLCHNCHHLVHHDKLEKQRFFEVLGLK